jgi:hypothetical protein
MTKLAPELPRGHAVGSSPDRRLVAIGLILAGLPTLVGTLGSVMIADEAIGPLVTLTLWLVLLFVRFRRSHSGFTFVEWFAIIGCLLTLQLLLDLHTRYLGDVVIAGLHVVALVALLVGAWRDRRAR